MPVPSTREVERELKSSKRRLSRSSSISRSQSPSIGRRTIPPISSLTTNDEMDISDTEQLVGQRRTSTHEELSLSLYLPPFYDIATAQESSNVR
ncbi:9636_t:CDS:2, partial [Rhizophagus irregularis]